MILRTLLSSTFLVAQALQPIVAAQGLQTQDEQTVIRSVIQRYIDIRNSGSQTGLKDLFTADADQLVSTGQWRHGRDEIVAGATISSKKENGKSSAEVSLVRLLTPDIALADARYQTTAISTPGPDAGVRKMWSTFVLKKVEGVWRIAAIRNMLPAPTVQIEYKAKPDH